MSEQLSLTDRATARISYIIKKEKKDNAVFRISVSGGGCSGFQYTFAVEDSYSKDDTILKKEGHSIDIFDTTYYAIDYGIDSDGSKMEKLNVVPYSMENRGR